MSIYRPTYLYVKQHNNTGLKYFGKTTQDPFKYRGSGKYWTSHIKVHGNNVTTTWTKLFSKEEELYEYAVQFSIENNIVESTEWANLKIENGRDGGNMTGSGIGKKHSEATKKLLSEINTGKKQSEETKKLRSQKMIGRTFSEEHLEKLRKPKPNRSKVHAKNISLAKKGKPWTDARREAEKNKSKT